MSTKKYTYSVFIGRFQPFHKGHLATLKFAESLSENVIILIGSSFSPRTIKNPFTFDERKQQILSVISSESISTPVEILPLEDFLYSNNSWITSVQETVNSKVNLFPNKIAIVGAEKDSSSSYLKWFPSWSFEPAEFDESSGLHATKIRELFFSEKNPLYFKSVLPSSVYSLIEEYRKEGWWSNLSKEYSFIQRYKKSWEVAPYEPIFVTVDAVVFQSGHILLVERKSSPGKGLLALPGGFIKPNETLEEGMIRELKEETSLKVPNPVLLGSVKERKVFDAPDRSLRGRTITHAFYIQLPNSNKLPKIKGGDDAKNAFWYPLSELNKYQLFEDHWDIINSVV
jgi:bifunctional NMN adenylyltransferase/nudix hydrolase